MTENKDVVAMKLKAMKRRLFLIGTAMATVMMFAEPAFAGFRGP